FQVKPPSPCGRVHHRLEGGETAQGNALSERYHLPGTDEGCALARERHYQRQEATIRPVEIGRKLGNGEAGLGRTVNRHAIVDGARLEVTPRYRWHRDPYCWESSETDAPRLRRPRANTRDRHAGSCRDYLDLAPEAQGA